MKKINFIAPIAGVSCALSVVTPLALTSCSSKSLIDLTKQYRATYNPLTNKSFDFSGEDEKNTEATNVWAKWLKQSVDNKHIDYFAQEYYWSASNFVTMFNNREFNKQYTFDKERISNFSVDIKNISRSGEADEYIPFISFTHTFNLTYKEIDSDIGQQVQRTEVGSIKYKHIPFIIVNNPSYIFSEGNNYWMIKPFLQYIHDQASAVEKFDFDYSIEIDEKITTEVKIASHTTSTNVEHNKHLYNSSKIYRMVLLENEDPTLWGNFVGEFDGPICCSYYLYSCPVKGQ